MPKAIDEIKKAIEKAISSRSNADALGRKAVEVVYRRVKSGLGVNNDAVPNPSLKPLKPLSRKYVELRQDARLGEFGAPSRSNLTLSGQMLKALTYETRGVGDINLTIRDTSRSPVYLGGRSVSQDLTNLQLAEYVSEARPFLNMTEDEKRIMAQLLDDLIQKEIDKVK